MGFADQAKIAAEDALGKVKEAVGVVTGKDDLKAEGQQDQAKANLQAAGEDVKDVFKK